LIMCIPRRVGGIIFRLLGLLKQFDVDGHARRRSRTIQEPRQTCAAYRCENLGFVEEIVLRESLSETVWSSVLDTGTDKENGELDVISEKRKCLRGVRWL
jgi:hypothetical protein